MSTPAVNRAHLPDVDLPKSVWSRSGRPIMGRISRAMFGTTLIFIGLALPWATIGMVVASAGVLGFFLVPVITDWLITRHEPKIRAATPQNAAGILTALEEKVLVSAFAPDAWVTLQRARLRLTSGDHRAAAQSFSDTARVIGKPEHPELCSAQARALLLAGDRAGARELLAAMAERNELTPVARLDLGSIMLGEAARAEKAREHLQAAYEQLDEHPQAAAALAVALARADETARALELLEQAEAAADADDELTKDAIKKARKALRPAREAKKKKKPRKG